MSGSVFLPRSARLLLASFVLLTGSLSVGAARAAVPVGMYCLTGLGSSTGGAADGWVAIVTSAGAVANLTPALTTALIDPWDCAIDPTNGDIIIADEGANGSGVNGAVYRVSLSAGLTQTRIDPPGTLINPTGVHVGQDGTVYVSDYGAATNGTTDGALYAIPPAAAMTRLDVPGVLQEPFDVDIDPRPFTGTSAGVNVVTIERNGGTLRRVPIAGGTVVTMPGAMGSNNWRTIEVGPYGNYFLTRDGNSVERYDRLTAANTQIAAGGGNNLAGPTGITVDYFTGDLVVADRSRGVINVPPGQYLGTPGTTVLAAPGTLPAGGQAAGIGFSPPRTSDLPSANFGMPTRRAPIPGGGTTLIGTANVTANGDVEYEINYFIEVTSTSSPLMIRIFDPNVRDGFDAPAGSYTSPSTFELFDPSGATVTAVTIPGNGRADLDQRIATLNSGNTMTMRGPGVDLAAAGLDAGLYHLRITIDSGDDFQVLGLWVEDFNTYTYSSVFGSLSSFTGAAPLLTPLDPARLHPYMDRGCEYTSSNFDLDVNSRPAGLALTTRLGESFSTGAGSLTGTANDVHAEDTVDPAPGGGTPASLELDYGLHRVETTLAPNYSENNLVTLRFPDFQGWADNDGTAPDTPTPPGNSPVNPTPSLRASPGPAFPQTPFGANTNTFLREYLPRYDEGPSIPAHPSATAIAANAAPYAPYMIQSATPLTTLNPTVGSPARYAVQITVVNPDPVNAMQNVIVASSVPAPTLYVDMGTAVRGPATVTGGGAVLPCGPAPCSGTIFAGWSSIAAGSAETLSYAVEATPTFPGERLYLTGGPAVRGGGLTPAANAAPASGATASFTPAWSSGAFPRSEGLGPLCDLSVQEGSVTPVAVDLASFEARGGDGEVWITWETASEFENLGFHLLRRLPGEAEPTRITPSLVLGRGTTDLQAGYAVRDRGVPTGLQAEYWLEDVEFDGTVTRHGPVVATPQAGVVAPTPDPLRYGEPVLLDPQTTAGSPTDAEPAAADAPPGNPIVAPATLRVVERSSRHLLLAIDLPPIELSPVSTGGATWLDAAVAGFGSTTRPGWPALPARTFTIEDAPSGNARLASTRGESERRVLAVPIVPVPRTLLERGDPIVRFEADPAAYSHAAAYPEALVRIASQSEAAAGNELTLRVQPTRFQAASGVLEHHRSIEVRIEFDDGAEEDRSAASAIPSDVASAAAIEITTEGRGLVEVTAEALLAAGLSGDTDPASLRLYRQGREISRRVFGGDDARLDPGDGLAFWAPGYEDRYTDRDVFRLTVDAEPGEALVGADATPGPGIGIREADATSLSEEQSVYLPGVRNGEDDNFVGPFVFDAPVLRDVATPGAVAEAGWLRVRLRGGTTWTDIPDDHHMEVRVGGDVVIDARFDGTELFEAVAPLPAAVLGGTHLTVQIAPTFDSGAPFDLVYLDALEVGYRRRLDLGVGEAQLVFEADENAPVEIGGIQNPEQARVWDVSDAESPLELEGIETIVDGLRFQAAAGARYAVSRRPDDPVGVDSDAGSSFSDGGAADWLAVGPADLLAELAPLVALRESQGLQTALVDIEDVFDEASGGRFSPPALRDFLSGIQATWDPPPRYVVLVGDASYDYRDFLGGSSANALPTMLVDTTFVEAASDTYFAASTSGTAPALGRLPVQTPDQLAVLVDKIVAYESDGSADPAWQSRLLLVADDGAGSGNPVETRRYEQALDAFAARTPGRFDLRRVALSELPDADAGEIANTEIRDALTDGTALTVYVGHGGANQWADELIFGSDDLQTLANPRWPLFLVLNCLNGFFDAPNEESFAEIALEAADRGAIAFVSSTRVSGFSGHEAFAEVFADRLLRGNVRRVGDAFRDAISAIEGLDNTEDAARTLVLLGDPATRLALPELPVADAGEDRIADPGGGATLDGSGSRGVAGGPLDFSWTVIETPEGATPRLFAADTASPALWAHQPGRYRLALVVTEDGIESAPDIVDVRVQTRPWAGCAGAGEGASTQASAGELLYLVIPALAARYRPRRRRR